MLVPEFTMQTLPTELIFNILIFVKEYKSVVTVLNCFSNVRRYLREFNCFNALLKKSLEKTVYGKMSGNEYNRKCWEDYDKLATTCFLNTDSLHECFNSVHTFSYLKEYDYKYRLKKHIIKNSENVIVYVGFYKHGILQGCVYYDRNGDGSMFCYSNEVLAKMWEFSMIHDDSYGSVFSLVYPKEIILKDVNHVVYSQFIVSEKLCMDYYEWGEVQVEKECGKFFAMIFTNDNNYERLPMIEGNCRHIYNFGEYTPRVYSQCKEKSTDSGFCKDHD